MPGFSLSILSLPRPNSGTKFSSSQILTYLDAATDSPGWPWHAKIEPSLVNKVGSQAAAVEESAKGDKLPVLLCESILSGEPKK